MNKSKGVGYVRVSTDEQAKEGLSIDAQIEKIKKKAKESNIELVEIFIDEGKTGTNLNRSGFQNALAKCKEEDISYLIVQDTSRISRDTSDYLTTKKVLTDYGVSIMSINQPLVEQNSPEAKFFDEIIAAQNAYQPRVTSMKVKTTTNAKFEFGWWPSYAPLGYLNVENNNSTCRYDRKIIKPCLEKAPLIKEMFEVYSTGTHSISELCEIMYLKGLTSRSGKMLSVSSMQQYLTNKFYFGIMTRNGDEKKGKHEPIISKALFDQVQYVLAQHRQFLIRKRKYNFLLRGFAFCHIHGRRLTAEWQKGLNSKNRDKIGYYHCTMPGGCKGTYIEVDKLENMVANKIKKYQFQPEFIELVRKYVKEYFEENRNLISSQKQGIINKRKAIEVKRTKLEDLILEGTIDRDIFKRKHSELQSELYRLENQMLDLDSQHNLDVDLIDEVLALTRNIHQTYLDAPYHLKRHYLRFFFEGIYIKDRKISKIAENTLFSTLRKEHQVLIRTNWLARWDDFRTDKLLGHIKYPDLELEQSKQILTV